MLRGIVFAVALCVVSCGMAPSQETMIDMTQLNPNGTPKGIPPEPIVETKSALLLPIRVGSLTSNICCTSSPPIAFMWLKTPTPLVPYMNSTQSAFTIDYKIGYVGTGSLNTLTFHIYRVNATVNNPFYYIATVNATRDDGSGHLQNLPNLATVSGWPTDQFLMIWENNNVELTVEDAAGNITWQLPNVGLTFVGKRPNAVYPPTVGFVVDVAHGCAHDMPGFDDDVQFDGHLDPVHAAYGISNLTPIAVQTMAPTTNSNCSVSAGWDGFDNFYQWHTGQ
jgi:hypothetical protein